jgi:hypothetical protein
MMLSDAQQQHISTDEWAAYLTVITHESSLPTGYEGCCAQAHGYCCCALAPHLASQQGVYVVHLLNKLNHRVCLSKEPEVESASVQGNHHLW